MKEKLLKFLGVAIVLTLVLGLGGVHTNGDEDPGPLGTNTTISQNA